MAESSSDSWPRAELTSKTKKSRPARRPLPRKKPSKKVVRVFCLKTMYCSPGGEPPDPAESRPSNLTQASTVRLVGWNAGVPGIWTKPLVPSKVKHDPTYPVAVSVAPPSNVPLLVLARSLALPSAGHHPISPAGVGTHCAVARQEPKARAATTSVGTIQLRQIRILSFTS